MSVVFGSPEAAAIIKADKELRAVPDAVSAFGFDDDDDDNDYYDYSLRTDSGASTDHSPTITLVNPITVTIRRTT